MERWSKPEWDELFIGIALLVSSRGTCDRLRTACVLTKNNRIIGSGYNGAVAGLPNCDEVDHYMVNGHCLRTLHGEDNAIANAVSSLSGATAYIIATPCLACVKKLLQYGVSRIVYVGQYSNIAGIEFVPEICKQKGVPLEQWSKDPADVALIFKKVFERLKGDGGLFRDYPNLELMLDFKMNIMKTLSQGLLIIFEGPEKAGKSTQIERLAGYLTGKGYSVFTTKEPGGGIPDLRSRVKNLDPNRPDLPEAEFEIFEEDRKVHFSKKIIPLKQAGKIILCDRNGDSTLAYQGYGRGMDLEKIRAANKKSTSGVISDLTFVLDLKPSVILDRIKKDRETEVTRFEKEGVEFHERVRQGFLTEAAKDPRRYVVLPADEDRNWLTVQIIKTVNERLGL